jgi:hypothetical protein
LPAKRLKWLRASGPRSQLQISSDAFCPPWTAPMKLPARDELLRIVAAAGVTLLVVVLAVLFFKWVFS